jgi:O-antigen ligase
MWAAAAAVVPDTALRAAILLAPVLAGVVWWTISNPNRWLILFFGAAVLTPPLPLDFAGLTVHLAPLFAALGVISGIVRICGWRSPGGAVPATLLVFMAVLTESVAFAALYSGWSVATGSLVRVLLFSITVYVFFYASAGPADLEPFSTTRILFGMGVVAALFACLDFYYQLPAPAAYGPQFVWLEEGLFRRAQGLFYEAGTLGNFCVFFLVMIVIALFRPQAARPCSRAVLAAGGIVFSAALLFSYSRASLLNLFVALCTFAWLERGRARRGILFFCACFFSATVLVHFVFPSFAGSYWDRLFASFEFILSSPNGVLSGRISTWEQIAAFLAGQPWHALFGIGYKTLPYSSVVGEDVIADNTYLSLLVETGILGVAALIALHAAILRTAARAARSVEPRTSFLGAWMLCFWTGEMVQMLFGDLITYWRVLPIYFFVLGSAVRGLRRSS